MILGSKTDDVIVNPSPTASIPLPTLSHPKSTGGTIMLLATIPQLNSSVTENPSLHVAIG